jgi:pyruvate/2-oxoglutarate dehydrogenase complex dihydrolipoamide dehydrogenase (E3) component
MDRIDTDICIIGAGSGGLSVAAGAAQMGARVVLIEGGEMGGDCLNAGCVPSKALIAAAKAAHAMRSGAQYGITPVEPAGRHAGPRRRDDEVSHRPLRLGAIDRRDGLVAGAGRLGDDHRPLGDHCGTNRLRGVSVAEHEDPFTPQRTHPLHRR